MPPAATPQVPTMRQLAKASRGAKLDKNSTSEDRAVASKPVVKTVLGNPLAVGWPSIPNHIQASILALMPNLIPPSIAAYHAARDRSHRSSKRKASKPTVAANALPVPSGPSSSAPPASLDAAPAPSPAFEPPEILAHLVIGLNETLKLVETATALVRLRSQVLHDALLAYTSGLLPAARAAHENFAPGPAYVLVPHLSVSPAALVAPVLAVVATHNAVVFQHAHVVRAARARIPMRVAEMGEDEVGECKVVPMGDREVALAEAAGLRRVAAVVIKASHPALAKLDALLPASVLKAPRHALTLPFAPLRVVDAAHGGAGGAAAASSAVSAAGGPGMGLEVEAELVPLPVKALSTAAPVDAGSRKGARLAEVRKRRVEGKMARRAERAKREREVGKWAGKGPRRHGKGLGKDKGKGMGKVDGERKRKGGEAKAESKEGGAGASKSVLKNKVKTSTGAADAV
ncbi:hypothetical protein Q5752_006669 [Cryptotrichosporon argae]